MLYSCDMVQAKAEEAKKNDKTKTRQRDKSGEVKCYPAKVLTLKLAIPVDNVRSVPPCSVFDRGEKICTLYLLFLHL